MSSDRSLAPGGPGLKHAGQPTEAGAPAGRPRFRALVVEDDFVSRQLLMKLLSPFADCDVAANGREGLQAVQRAWEADNPYDLLCLDIMMPEMNGQELLEEIRRQEREQGIGPGEAARIIMTTALCESESVLGAMVSGCEAYLMKPIVKVSLLETIRKLGLISYSL